MVGLLAHQQSTLGGRGGNGAFATAPGRQIAQVGAIAAHAFGKGEIFARARNNVARVEIADRAGRYAEQVGVRGGGDGFIQRLFFLNVPPRLFHYRNRIIFGHQLSGNPHSASTPSPYDLREPRLTKWLA
jgi:hypothetical protein